MQSYYQEIAVREKRAIIKKLQWERKAQINLKLDEKILKEIEDEG